jgi:Gluconate 2-dehydrogenase subunit 3
MATRREAMGMLGSFVALPFLGSLGVEQLVDVGREMHARAELRRAGRSFKPRVLNQAQYALVATAAERIIPRTSTPGATDARVADFVDTMLADWYPAVERDRFLAGLKQLDTRLAGQRAFITRDEREQAEILGSFDDDVQRLRRAGSPDANLHWFAMLKFLTVWGYYTSRVGVVEELRIDVSGGRFDGNAAYAQPSE